MSIVTENLTINSTVFKKTYSDSGMMIQRDGVRYSEAVDPLDSGRVYTETEEPIDSGTEEATVEDYQSALHEFGVEV